MGRVSGNTIVLREFRWEDLPDIRAWVTDPAITQWLSGAFMKPHTWEQTEQYLRNLLEGGSGANFVIARREDLAYLGQCNLMMVDNVSRKAEMAMVLQAQHAGQGIGTQAGELLMDFAFRQMNLNRVHLRVYADNLRAIRLYRKLGFRQEGCLREDTYRDGAYRDTLAMGLLRREWMERTLSACPNPGPDA